MVISLMVGLKELEYYVHLHVCSLLILHLMTLCLLKP